ncbi:hypothetical protein AKJ09_08279 [Labilithrix luteola]|uniref:Uncharacterized protein n=1 Tax=Labilithrix luteola TaxID=1391654 RepID=A0A0K1Q708_9BACT|nr:hypothetical protein [Labilithrix luteola]AKV01616.1 hypothetical protein AKJ09_08279 [Labilithrix luteola]
MKLACGLLRFFVSVGSLGARVGVSVRVIGAAIGIAAVAGVGSFEREAQASVSIAVTFDALVKDADAVAVVTPVEHKSVWENGRIYTYTRVKVDQAVAGDVASGGEGWVRTMGGVVGKIGQRVEGEAVLTEGSSSFVFLRKQPDNTNNWIVSARAQGQFPVVVDEALRIRKLVRANTLGAILPPKPTQGGAQGATTGPVADPTKAFVADPSTLRLAGEVFHERSIDDATREVTTAWKRLHPAPAKTTTPSK